MEFPDLGRNCSEKSCNKLDFLPMKCDVCLLNFCDSHFRYTCHGCVSPAGRDVQVPACPLCGAAVAGVRGQPPDVAVSAHIDNDCRARGDKIFSNRCTLRGCKQREAVPLLCGECRLNFCFRHRYPDSHSCQGKLAAKRRQAELAAMSRARSKEPPRPDPVTTATHFAQVQGQMSEDEALARALSLSLSADSAAPRSRPAPSTTTATSQDNKCNIS